MSSIEPAATTVLVTGASGFIGLHCVRELLARGYRVRGTVRSLERGPSLQETLSKYVDASLFELVEANLMEDGGWSEAMKGCRFVLHVASPVPSEPPKYEDEVIVPAREGTLRVLRAAAAARVERVVLTSSIAAVADGHPRDPTRIFTEEDWSNLDGDLSAYDKSKTLAERAAWEFVRNLPAERAMELSVINPGLVLGPLLEAHHSISIEAVRKLMRKEYPGAPRLGWPTVDVRDVADAHVAAMTLDFVWMKEIAEILQRNFASEGYVIPTRTLPNFLVRLVGLFDKVTAVAVPRLDLELHVSNGQIKRILGWQPRGTEEQVVSTGRSLIDLGIA
jgi:nucleoside-diphosphate-sugar epimerase